jgi:hypothetical protein
VPGLSYFASKKRPSEVSAKKYSKPVLKVWGDVAKLTQSGQWEPPFDELPPGAYSRIIRLLPSD